MKNSLSVQEPTGILRQLISEESEKRLIMTEYIRDHMKQGIDYGPIHIARDCANKYNCTIKAHFSKDCLFKPGSEKFLSLMKLTARFHRDQETWEMVGSQPGTLCYVCELTNLKGAIIGEGRGSCSVQEKGNANTAIKIAQKRAQTDAVIRTGGLSDFFTMDLEDMDTTKDEPPMTDKQLGYILMLLQDRNKTFTDLQLFTEKLYKIKPAQMNLNQASYVISRLQGGTHDKGEILTNEDYDEIDRGIEKERLEGSEKNENK